jgi:hypothetical protein
MTDDISKKAVIEALENMPSQSIGYLVLKRRDVLELIRSLPLVVADPEHQHSYSDGFEDGFACVECNEPKIESLASLPVVPQPSDGEWTDDEIRRLSTDLKEEE